MIHVNIGFLWRRLFDRLDNLSRLSPLGLCTLIRWTSTNRFFQANNTMEGQLCLAACDQSFRLAEAYWTMLFLLQVCQSGASSFFAQQKHCVVGCKVTERLSYWLDALRQHQTKVLSNDCSSTNLPSLDLVRLHPGRNPRADAKSDPSTLLHVFSRSEQHHIFQRHCSRCPHCTV